MIAMMSQITSLTIVYPTVIQAQIRETSKLRVTGLCAGNSPVTGEFPEQRGSNAENVYFYLMTSSCVCRFEFVRGVQCPTNISQSFSSKRSFGTFLHSTVRTRYRMPLEGSTLPFIGWGLVVEEICCEWYHVILDHVIFVKQISCNIRSSFVRCINNRLRL